MGDECPVCKGAKWLAAVDDDGDGINMEGEKIVHGGKQKIVRCYCQYDEGRKVSGKRPYRPGAAAWGEEEE